MTSPTRVDEGSPPKRSVGARVAGLIERTCVIGVRVSIPITLTAVSVLFAYLIGGFALLQLEFWSPSYQFLSLTDDVYFAWFAFLTGGSICLGTGSLIGLAYLSGGEGPVHNEISILASFIGFGFGAAAMRLTYATVLASVF